MSTRSDQHWRARAVCAQPGPLGQLATADIEAGLRGPERRAVRDDMVKRMCVRCPVRQACLDDDLT